MTTEEKLRHFTTVILESTDKQCETELNEYKKGLDKYFDEHKEEALKKKELEEKIESDRIKRKSGREYTTEQLHIRRKINHKQEELKQKLLEEVKELLNDYFKTDDYKELLVKQIKKAKQVARGEQLTIYIDKKDEGLKAELEKETGEELLTDERTFFGGIKAEIPRKNILIDDSFESKLENWMDTYLIEVKQ